MKALSDMGLQHDLTKSRPRTGALTRQIVVPAKAGTQSGTCFPKNQDYRQINQTVWIPAFAGMTAVADCSVN